jgi:SAM-dependent methyltransferase
MNDETENDGISVETVEAASVSVAVVEGDGAVVLAEAAPLSSPPPVRSKPPPKPRTRPALPSSRPPAPGESAPPVARPSSPAGTASTIKPMLMIKLGQDSPRSDAPASALDRPSSRPPPVHRRSVPPPVVPPGPRSVDERSFDPPTEPRLSFDPPTQPRGLLDPPTEPIVDYDATADDERVTPEPILRSVPPRPPSARASMQSAPDIEVVASHDGEVAEDMPEVDVAPASEDEPISLPEETISISVTVGGGEGEGAASESAAENEGAEQTEESKDADKSSLRKPPPPPKRKGAVPPAPSERAVAQALEAPRFEPLSTKPRAKPWWEELFTDDFGRGILPPTESQVRREVDFIEDSLAVAKGGVVLDLACGNGHHAVDLSSRGYGVVGFDLSLPQLAVAGEYAQQRGQKINFLQGDMRDMSFEEVFDGIYCWNTSFGYFEEERNFAVAQRVFKALRPGGSFLLDVINRDFVVEHQPSQVWFEGDSCICMDDMSVDFITSRLRVKRTMMLDDGRTRECAFSIRIYSLHELGKLLHDIGFRVTEASGHPAYPGVFFGATSPRVVILAQKP